MPSAQLLPYAPVPALLVLRPNPLWGVCFRVGGVLGEGCDPPTAPPHPGRSWGGINSTKPYPLFLFSFLYSPTPRSLPACLPLTTPGDDDPGMGSY